MKTWVHQAEVLLQKLIALRHHFSVCQAKEPAHVIRLMSISLFSTGDRVQVITELSRANDGVGTPAEVHIVPNCWGSTIFALRALMQSREAV